MTHPPKIRNIMRSFLAIFSRTYALIALNKTRKEVQKTTDLTIPLRLLPREPSVAELCPPMPIMPTYASAQSAGMDLCAYIPQAIIFNPGERTLIPTGISIALPPGYEAQIRGRSGLSYKHGITVLNSPGTIDGDYRGEIKVILIHVGQTPYTIEPGERIAQCIIAPVMQGIWKKVDSLETTVRGEGGFGSTGR